MPCYLTSCHTHTCHIVVRTNNTGKCTTHVRNITTSYTRATWSCPNTHHTHTIQLMGTANTLLVLRTCQINITPPPKDGCSSRATQLCTRLKMRREVRTEESPIILRKVEPENQKDWQAPSMSVSWPNMRARMRYAINDNHRGLTKSNHFSPPKCALWVGKRYLRTMSVYNGV